MRILLIFLTMAGSQGWQARGCLFPVCLFCFKRATVIAKAWPGVESEIIELDLPGEQGLPVQLNAYVLPGEINRFSLYKQ